MQPQLDYEALGAGLRARGYDEDAIQETLLKLLERERKGLVPSSPLAYAARITWHIVTKKRVAELHRHDLLKQYGCASRRDATPLEQVLSRETLASLPPVVVEHAMGGKPMNRRTLGEWRKTQ